MFSKKSINSLKIVFIFAILAFVVLGYVVIFSDQSHIPSEEEILNAKDTILIDGIEWKFTVNALFDNSIVDPSGVFIVIFPFLTAINNSELKFPDDIGINGVWVRYNSTIYQTQIKIFANLSEIKFARCLAYITDPYVADVLQNKIVQIIIQLKDIDATYLITTTGFGDIG